MIRHALAPIHAPAARALSLPRTLGELPLSATDRKVSGANVALTFDDGPHPEGTPEILEILAAHGARATFFVVGEQVARRPELLRRAVAEGHDVQLHAHRHRLQSRRTARALRADYERGIAAVEDALGRTPTLHRPPFGIYSPWGLRLAREAGLQPLLWAGWGRDWRKHTNPEQICRRVTRNLDPGDVVLLHDADYYSAEGSHRRTAAALRLILTKLESRGIGTVLPV